MASLQMHKARSCCRFVPVVNYACINAIEVADDGK